MMSRRRIMPDVPVIGTPRQNVISCQVPGTYNTTFYAVPGTSYMFTCTSMYEVYTLHAAVYLTLRFSYFEVVLLRLYSDDGQAA